MNSACPPDTSSDRVRSLLQLIKSYSFPLGEDAARTVRGIKTTQRGEIRSGPEARWVPFTAEEYVDATRSGFRWDAHMGTGLMSVQVTDAYENGHGRLTVRKGLLKLHELTGPDVDKGELQRYLAYLSYCAPMLVNHGSLELAALNSAALRVCDKSDSTGAFVDVEIADSGQIGISRAVRPMTVGKQTILTPWSAISTDFREIEGLRVPWHLEASWNPPAGSFTYVRMEIITFAVLR